MGSDFKLSDSARRLGLGLSQSLPSGNAIIDWLRRRWIYVSIVVLVLAGLSLPPISLPGRLTGGLGCTALTEQKPELVHPDGISIKAAPNSRLSVKLSSVPRLNLLEGSAGGEWKKAVEALPANLAVKSPLYQLGICGKQGQAELAVTIPNDAEPWETLDLYTWTGTNWQWLGSSVDKANERISAQVDELPANLVVVQTEAVAPAIASDIATSKPEAPDGLEAVLNEVVVPGLLVGSLGGVQGAPLAPEASGQAATYAMIPAVRNWSADNALAKPNVGLVMDMLGDAQVRAEHVKQLTAVVSDAPYAGLQIDYRDVPADSHKDFTTFVDELAAALHKSNKLLSVVLPPPAPTVEGGWDTGGYDWRAIGALADAVVIEPTTDLLAYSPNGQAEQIVRWATTQISRYKLQLAFSALSERVTGDSSPSAKAERVAYEEALKPFGKTAAVSSVQVTPGEKLTVHLDGHIQDLSYDKNAKLYSFTPAGPDKQTVYLVTAGALSDRLELATRYNLRGVLIHGLMDTPGSSDTRLLDALQQYKDKASPAVPGALQVVWTMRNQAGDQLPGATSSLTHTDYVWTVPSTPGHYVVAAAIPGAASRGELTIEVLAATPTPSPTPSPTPGPTPDASSATPDAASQAADCWKASYVADVTVPDGQKYDKGAAFTKTWKVKNTGSCDWKTGVALTFESGERMEGAESVSVGAAKAGGEIEVSVPMKSPGQDGNYTGVWRFKNPDGQAFGEQLSVLIVSGNPAPSNVPAGGAPAPVGGGSFEIGGHVAGFSRADLMKKAGMKWIKVQVHHGAIPSDMIAAAHNNGFKILFGALGDKGSVMQGTYQNEYAQWLAALAQAGADAIEVWNEPNIDHEWPVGQINGANYAALLAKAYPAIKAASPGTLVISAALAPTGYFATGCADNGCNDDVFLGQMAAAGAANYADCIGAHHNAGATAPSATLGHPGGSHYSWYFWPTLNLYYNTFGGARKVCFTEFGYVSDEGFAGLETAAPNFAWAKDVTVAQQASWLAEAASLSGNSGKVRLMIIWNVDFTYYGSDPQAGYAIIRPGGSCPACDALGQVMGSR